MCAIVPTRMPPTQDQPLAAIRCALVCYPPFRGRLRYSDRAKTIGAQRCHQHDDLPNQLGIDSRRL